MSKLQAVNWVDFKDKAWRRAEGFSFARQQKVVPITGSEVGHAAHAFPLAFLKQGQQWELVGLLSLSENDSAYIGYQGEWLAEYIPAFLRAYPFQLTYQAQTEQWVLCFDLASELLTDSQHPGAQPFFKAQDQVDESVQSTLTFLSEIEKTRRITQQLVTAIAAQDLLVPWELKLQHQGQQKNIMGLYRMDEERLNSLSDTAFNTLRAQGALTLIYGQMFSMHHIQAVIRHAETNGIEQLDLNQIFGG